MKNNPFPDCSPNSVEWAFRTVALINRLNCRVKDLEQELAELKDAARPVVEWWQREKKINARANDVLYVLAHIRSGVVMTQVTPSQLDALAEAVGEE